MRFRLAVVSAVAFLALALLPARQAQAAAEVHRFSLMLSGIPTQVVGGDFNDYIDQYDKTILNPQGWEPLPHVAFTWEFDAELRYFARPNFALALGVGQIKSAQKKEYLPSITDAIDIRGEVLTVPVHVGAAYYLQPFNQGDFQARAFIGGGLVQYTYTRATFEQIVMSSDSTFNAAPNHTSFKTVLTQDAPGYYLEAGGHMFFANRYSVLISGIYRTGEVRNMQYDTYRYGTQTTPAASVPTNSKGQPYKLDVGGVGLRLSFGIGF